MLFHPEKRYDYSLGGSSRSREEIRQGERLDLIIIKIDTDR